MIAGLSKRTAAHRRGWKLTRSDASLSALLAAQVLITFVAVRALALRERRAVRIALLSRLLGLAAIYLAHGEEKRRGPSE